MPVAKTTVLLMIFNTLLIVVSYCSILCSHMGRVGLIVQGFFILLYCFYFLSILPQVKGFVPKCVDLVHIQDGSVLCILG